MMGVNMTIFHGLSTSKSTRTRVTSFFIIYLSYFDSKNAVIRVFVLEFSRCLLLVGLPW